jgi:TatD DNase family protein
MPDWIDTHAHLDVWSLPENIQLARQYRAAGVAQVLLPAVAPNHFDTARALAKQLGCAYALGIHPMYVAAAGESALAQLAAALQAHAADPHLVAVGEAGLDFFLPELRTEPLRQQQTACYHAQIRLAQAHGLPLVLHVRQSVDAVLKELRAAHFTHGGIAHAFNGSMQQAEQFLDLGFKLGFGGACTHARATHLQDLAKRLPAHAIVMETDSPDMPPAWAYTPKHLREQGQRQAPNTPLELPRIAAFVAQLRQVDVAAWQTQTTANALAALPRLQALLEANTQ